MNPESIAEVLKKHGIEYRRKGIFVALFLGVSMLLSLFVGHRLNSSNVGLLFIPVWIISAVCCFLLDLYLNKKYAADKEKIYTDEETGKQIKGKDIDSFYYVPVRFWKFIFAGAAVINMIIVLPGYKSHVPEGYQNTTADYQKFPLLGEWDGSNYFEFKNDGSFTIYDDNKKDIKERIVGSYTYKIENPENITVVLAHELRFSNNIPMNSLAVDKLLFTKLPAQGADTIYNMKDTTKNLEFKLKKMP